MFGYFKRRRRARVRAIPFSEDAIDAVRYYLPLYEFLPPEDQTRLLGDMRVFMSEKHFEGCGGLRLTDDMVIAVASHACLLTLHRDIDDYAKLVTVLMYPTSFYVDDQVDVGDGVFVEGEDVHEGESWGRGVVIFAWNEVKRDIGRPEYGVNVLFHECAHQIDPWHASSEEWDHVTAPAWPEVFVREFAALNRAADARRRTFIDEYGAEHPAEFFAVLTEHFFTVPQELRAEHAELYQTLAQFYRQDPAQLLDDFIAREEARSKEAGRGQGGRKGGAKRRRGGGTGESQST